MRQRCSNAKNSEYKNYGARGILVCSRWANSFLAFWQDMGPTWKPGLELDRRNNNGNYDLGNCRWTDSRTQKLNRRKQTATSSDYIGVCFDKWSKNWKAQHRVGGRTLHCGRFDDAAAAAQARDATVIKYSPGAPLNFPHFIRTFTGRPFWPLAPRAEDLDIRDVAHALACSNRYTGHTYVPYSIAQHCCHVSDLLPGPLKLCGLLHDASEAYLVDLPTPVKRQLPEYGPAEERLMEIIAVVFGFPWPMPPEVKLQDTRLLITEQRDQMGYINPGFPDLQPLEKKIIPWGWRKAEREFLKRFYQLRPNK